jgi:hypothetical protein
MTKLLALAAVLLAAPAHAVGPQINGTQIATNTFVTVSTLTITSSATFSAKGQAIYSIQTSTGVNISSGSLIVGALAGPTISTVSPLGFFGNGSGLTGLTPANISAGTLGAGVIASSIAASVGVDYLASSQTLTGQKIFTSTVGVITSGLIVPSIVVISSNIADVITVQNQSNNQQSSVGFMDASAAAARIGAVGYENNNGVDAWKDSVFLGSLGVSKRVVFVMGNSEKMRVDTTGRVGIATTTPAFTFDVGGTINATAYSGPILSTSIAAGSLGSGVIASSISATADVPFLDGQNLFTSSNTFKNLGQTLTLESSRFSNAKSNQLLFVQDNSTGNLNWSMYQPAFAQTDYGSVVLSSVSDPSSTLHLFTFGSGGSLTATAFTGDGAGLTALTAANILSGTLGSSVIASSIAVNSITNANQFNANTLPGPLTHTSSVTINNTNGLMIWQAGQNANLYLSSDGTAADGTTLLYNAGSGNLDINSRAGFGVTTSSNTHLGTATGTQMFRCSGGTAALLLTYGNSGAEATICTGGGGTMIGTGVFLP